MTIQIKNEKKKKQLTKVKAQISQKVLIKIVETIGNIGSYIIQIIKKKKTQNCPHIKRLNTLIEYKLINNFIQNKENSFFSISIDKLNNKTILEEGKELKQKHAKRLPRCSWPYCWTRVGYLHKVVSKIFTLFHYHKFAKFNTLF